MRFKFYALLLVYLNTSYAINNQLDTNTAQTTWANALETQILYQQIFTSGFNAILDKVNESDLTQNTWGIVFALENTLLNPHSAPIGANEQQNPSGTELNASSGAVEITCAIKDLGGYVFIITNRIGESAIINTTLKALDQQQICYSNVIFSNGYGDTNKNPRFNAVISGDYENVISSKQLPATKIIAYFGSKLQDFPNFQQSSAHLIKASDPRLNDFAETYFMLPRFNYWQN